MLAIDDYDPALRCIQAKARVIEVSELPVPLHLFELKHFGA
jgi:hypothetical protein